MPIFIPFIIKGAVVLGKAIVASHKASVIAKATIAATKTYGTASVVAGATSACIVVGGIAWSADRVVDLKTLYTHWENRDWTAFSGGVASFLSKMHSVATDAVVSSAETILKDAGFDTIHIGKFCKDVFDLGNEFSREIDRPAIS